MARDGSIQPPEPFHGVSPAPAGFTSLGDAANMAIGAVIGAMEARTANRLVPDCAGYFEDMAERDVATVAAKIRQALADTLQGDFTDEQIEGAAHVIVDFPTAWRDYRPWEGTPPALSAYKEALDEIEEPALTVKRLERHAGWKFDAATKHLDGAKEALGRFTWASADPVQVRASFEASMNCASREFEAGAALMASAEGFRAKLAEAVQ